MGIKAYRRLFVDAIENVDLFITIIFSELQRHLMVP